MEKVYHFSEKEVEFLLEAMRWHWNFERSDYTMEQQNCYDSIFKKLYPNYDESLGQNQQKN